MKERIAMKINIYITILFISIKTSVFGALLPIPCSIDGEEDIVNTNFVLEVKEVPFLGITGRDKIFVDYMAEVSRKDVLKANNYVCPEMRVFDESEIEALKKMNTGYLLGVLKYAYNGYDVYFGTTTEGGSFHLGLRQDEEHPLLNPLMDSEKIRSITSVTLGHYFETNGTRLEQADIASMSNVAYGSNDVVKIHFTCKDDKSNEAVALENTTKRLHEAYVKKNLDELAELVTEISYKRLLVQIMNGGYDRTFDSSDIETLFVVDIDPIYLYVYKQSGGDIVGIRKYIKEGDRYLLFNYNIWTLTVEEFIESEEFISYIKEYMEKEEKGSPIIGSGPSKI